MVVACASNHAEHGHDDHVAVVPMADPVTSVRLATDGIAPTHPAPHGDVGHGLEAMFNLGEL